MSNYLSYAVNPRTGKKERCAMIDNHFGRNKYGVKFFKNYDKSKDCSWADELEEGTYLPEEIKKKGKKEKMQKIKRTRDITVTRWNEMVEKINNLEQCRITDTREGTICPPRENQCGEISKTVKDGEFVNLYGRKWQKFTITDENQIGTLDKLRQRTVLHAYEAEFLSCFGFDNDYEKSTLKLAFNGWKIKMAQTISQGDGNFYEKADLETLTNTATIPTKEQYKQMIEQGLKFSTQKSSWRWTSSAGSTSGTGAWVVGADHATGSVDTYHAFDAFGVDPTLWLKSKLVIKSGKGTLDEPYEVEIGGENE